MARLPTVGGDDGGWGTILNTYLSVEHGSGGTHSEPLTVQLIMKATVITSGATSGSHYSVSATTDQIIVVDKSSASASYLDLPASPTTGTTYRIKDGKGDAATNNITIAPASGTIDGDSNVIINANYASVDLVYNGTEWNII